MRAIKVQVRRWGSGVLGFSLSDRSVEKFFASSRFVRIVWYFFAIE